MEKKFGAGSLRERASGTLDLPGEVLADLPRVEITGGQKLTVENHKGLLACGENEIRVAGRHINLTIRGDSLVLETMSSRELSVTGRIFGLDFEY